MTSQELMAAFKKADFLESDVKSFQKFLKLERQLSFLKLEKDDIINILFPNIGQTPKKHSKTQMKIFRETSVDGSYFNVLGKLNQANDELEPYGFSTDKYLKALVKDRDLLFWSPDKLRNLLKEVEDSSPKLPVSAPDFLDMCFSQTTLMRYDFTTLQTKILDISKHIGKHELSSEEIGAFLKKEPTILTLNSQKVMDNIDKLLSFHNQKYWRVWKEENTTKNAMRQILKYPRYLMKNPDKWQSYEAFSKKIIKNSLSLSQFLRKGAAYLPQTISKER